MDDRPLSSALASYFVSKTKMWQTTPFANNAGKAAAHNVIQQSSGPTRFTKSQCSDISDTFILFSHSSLGKNLSQKTIVYSSLWKPFMVAHG